MAARYKKPPIDSYISISNDLRKPKQQKTAEELRRELLTRLREE